MRKFFSYIVVGLCLASCATPPKPALIADLDPLETETVTVGISKIFPVRVDQVTVPLTFDPRENTVYLQFSYQFVTYRQYWDEAARRQFIAAVQQYKQDFEAQRLTLRGSRARRAYGIIRRAKTEWGHIKYMINSLAYPRVELGYTFHRDSPYFLVTQRGAKNVAPVASNNPSSSSLQIELYFTRSMAEALAAAFDQEALLSYLPDARYIPPPGETAVAPDTYNHE